MAVITKIRNRSGLLIGVIGVAMVLFILGDLLNNNQSLLSGQDSDVAVIGGEAITYREFEVRVEKEIKQQYPNQPVNENIRRSVRNRLWNQLLQEKILFKEYAKLGLELTDNELFEQIRSGNPIVRQYFTNPQTQQLFEQFTDPNRPGQLNPDAVLGYIKNMFDTEQEQSWLPVEKAVRLDRLNTKYNNLIKKGLYATNQEAAQEHKFNNRRIDFTYAVKRYTDIQDGDVSYDESDLNAYYKENKWRPEYQQENETRAIEYIEFDLIPSAKDSADEKATILNLIADFKATDNDSTYLVLNSDSRKPIQFYGEGSFTPAVDSVLMKGDTGSVVGPFILDGAYNLAKVVSVKSVPDSVNARHILVNIENGDTATAQGLIDSLQAVINRGGDFEALAKEFSDDLGSGEKGGDLGWFTEGRMVKPFNDACFAGKVGDMPVVTSQFGIHMIEIMEQTAPKRKVEVAILDKTLEASEETKDELYRQASTYSIDNNTADLFHAGATAEGRNYIIKKIPEFQAEDRSMVDFTSPRQLILWAFNADREVGNVSEKVFDVGNKYIVATLSEIREKGTLTMDVQSIRDKVTLEVMNQKKAELIVSQIGSATEVGAVAESIGAATQNSTNLSFSTNAIPGLGSDGLLIGTVFSLAEGSTSTPIVTDRGVVVVRIDRVAEASEPSEAELASNKLTLSNKRRSRVDFEVFEALKSQANVVDNRSQFY